MGQGLANVVANPLCCAQDCRDDSGPIVKASPSLKTISVQSRNLQDMNWEVRAEAADFFGRLDPESVVLVVPMLQELLLKDESWHVRQHAASALQDLGGEAVAMAVHALQKTSKEDGHYTVRLAAACALRKYGHKAEASKPLSREDMGVQYTVEQNTHSLPNLDQPPTLVDDKENHDTRHQDNRLEPAPKPGFLLSEDMLGFNKTEAMPGHHSNEEATGERLSSLGDTSGISLVSSPSEFTIVVQRGPSGKWGIDVDFVVHGTCLRVSRVKAGVISEWNEEHPEAAIDIGDLLMEMNGVSGDSKELVKILSKADQLEILVHKADKTSQPT